MPDDKGAREEYEKAVLTDFRHLLILGQGQGQGQGIQEAYLPLRMIALDKGRSVLAHEQIGSSERCFILGGPGSGKTTLLRYVAYKCAESQRLIPIFVRIGRYVKTASTLEDHLHNVVQGATNRTTANLLTGEDDFGQEETLVLLDGLDEVRDDERRSFLARLNEFLVAYPRCGVVVSSRVSNFQASEFVPLGFKFYQLSALTEESIKKYIWEQVPESTREEIWRLIQSNDRISELAQVPFMLAMLCAARLEPGKIIDRASLFANCTEYLLKKRGVGEDDAELNPVSNEAYQELESVLKVIAVRFFKLDTGDCISQDELEFVIHTTTPQRSSTDLINHLVDRAGLLQRAGEEHSFVHRSIGEYYVALGMQDGAFDSLVDRASVPSWEEPIKLYVGLTDVDRLEEVVEAIWNRNRGLALRSLTELPEFPDQLLRNLLDGLERDGRVRLSHEIIDAARRTGSRRERKRILLDSCSALLRVETDCEVIYNCVVALTEAEDYECRRLVEEVLDLANAEKRRQKYIANPNFFFEFVRIPKCEFEMGYDESPDARERPAHRVLLSEFQVAKYPVVNVAYYDAFPYATDRRGLGGYSSDEAQPVNNISWFEAIMFAWWMGCDLPTEAEWEYACRAGGNDDLELMDERKVAEYAWYEGNSDNRTHCVGKKKANSFGLHDMLGNVREWVKDWYSEADFYQYCYDQGEVKDPIALEGSDRKVLRGGVFDWATRNLRPTYRPMNPPDNVFFGNGMRLMYRKGVSVPFLA